MLKLCQFPQTARAWLQNLWVTLDVEVGTGGEGSRAGVAEVLKAVFIENHLLLQAHATDDRGQCMDVGLG